MKKLLSLLLILMSFSVTVSAQTKTVTGKVTDEKGVPVISASVSTKDGKYVAITDEKGNFAIKIPDAVRELVVSSVNFETQNVPIKKSDLTISLVSRNQQLEEVVVNTGYQRIKKSQYTGATDKLSRQATKDAPVASFDNALQGKVAGLTILSGSGQPGSSANVVLRGLTSIQGGSQPLYVLDGMPIEASVFQSLNANDFESVEVLKDASAQALYGSRGASGVIVITTRKGTGEKMKLITSSQFGIIEPPQSNYQMMNGAQLLKAQEKYGVAAGLQGNAGALMYGWNYSPLNPAYQAATPAQQAVMNRLRDSISNINTDWDNLFFRKGVFVRQDLTLSGGGPRLRYLSNFGYYKEDGITDRTDLQRFTWRNNADYSDNKLSAQFNTSIGFTKRNFQESTTSNNLRNPFLASRLTPPTVRLWLPGKENSGDYLTGLAVGTGNQFAGANLYQLNQLNKNYNDQIKLLASASLLYKFGDGFNVSGLAGADMRQTQGTFYSDPRVWYNTSSADVRIKSGSISESLDRFFQTNLRAGLGYNKNFATKHEVDLNVYAEILSRFQKGFSETAYGVDPRLPNTMAGTTQGTVANQLVANTSGFRTRRNLVSEMVLGRYTFDSKYTISGSFRIDGSSQLPKDNRFQNFYSVGAIWDMAKESFIKKSKLIGELRLRASYGTSANADNFSFNDFNYLPSYSIGSDGGGNTTQFISNVGNLNLNWEYTKQADIGLDFAILKGKNGRDRIYGTFDVYDKKTVSAIAFQQISQTSGVGGFNANTGVVRNKGIEGKVNFDLVQNKNMTITVYANSSYNKNNVESLGSLGEYPLGTSLVKVGKPLGTHWEVGWAGVEPASGRPLYYDANGNVTTTYSASYKTQNWGSWFAPYQGGFGTNIQSKGFDVNIGFIYSKGSTRVNNLEFFVENPASFLATGLNQANTLNFWSYPGDVNATTQSPLYPVNFSSKYIQDASFLRLKTMTLGYTVPKAAFKNNKFVSNIRFYVTGQNLYTWTKWKGYDPEDDNNISLSEFPNPRSVTAGLDITF